MLYELKQIFIFVLWCLPNIDNIDTFKFNTDVYHDYTNREMETKIECDIKSTLLQQVSNLSYNEEKIIIFNECKEMKIDIEECDIKSSVLRPVSDILFTEDKPGVFYECNKVEGEDTYFNQPVSELSEKSKFVSITKQENNFMLSEM